MIASQIGAALKARLSSLTFTPALPVGWPNRDFVPSGDHLTVAIVPAEAERLGVKAMHRFAGSMVVTVCLQRGGAVQGSAGGGSGRGDGIADAVAAHFPADLRLSLSGGGTLRITQAPSVREGFIDAGYWRTPVLIPFEVLTA